MGPIISKSYLGALGLNPLTDHSLLVMVHESVALRGGREKRSCRWSWSNHITTAAGRRAVNPHFALVPDDLHPCLGDASFVETRPVDPLLFFGIRHCSRLRLLRRGSSGIALGRRFPLNLRRPLRLIDGSFFGDGRYSSVAVD